MVREEYISSQITNFSTKSGSFVAVVPGLCQPKCSTQVLFFTMYLNVYYNLRLMNDIDPALFSLQVSFEQQ
jgi:hypothetical protein